MKKFKFREIDEKNVKIWIGIVVLSAIVIVGIFLFFTRPSELDRLNASYVDIINKKEVKKNVKVHYGEKYELKDYAIYGESLNLYHDTLTGESGDDTLGKIIILRNLETNDEFTFTFTGGADGGIPLGQIDEGFYEVYIYDHYEKKRLYFKEEFTSKPFSTMRRDGKVKNITLSADENILEPLNMELDNNYLFLTIVDSVPKVKVNDVIINPGGNVFNNAINGVEVGAVSSLASEPKETYELAIMVQTHLQNAGLRVEISRGLEEANSYYGKNSRVGIGYASQAKVYVNLSMIEDNDVTRPFMFTSPHSNAGLANQISYTLSQANIQLQDLVSNSALERGVVYDSTFIDEKGEYTKFEVQPGLRETGGKCTFAGTMDFAKANSNFSKAYGMESVIFYAANVTSKDSMDYYHENKELMAKKIAEAILTYYQIGGEGIETTTK